MKKNRFSEILEYSYNFTRPVTEDEDEDIEGMDDSNSEDMSDEDMGDEDMSDEEDEFEFEEEEDGEDGEMGDEFEEEDFEEEEDGDVEEIDVTDIVDKQDDAQIKLDDLNARISNLQQHMDASLKGFSKLEDIEKYLAKIDKQNEKLEKEIIYRNPTPLESMNLRSMDSFPYNTKIADYFTTVDGEKETKYSILNPQDPNAKFEVQDVEYKKKDEFDEEEYVLTTKDLEDEYNEFNIKQSL